MILRANGARMGGPPPPLRVADEERASGVSPSRSPASCGGLRLSREPREHEARPGRDVLASVSLAVNLDCRRRIVYCAILVDDATAALVELPPRLPVPVFEMPCASKVGAPRRRTPCVSSWPMVPPGCRSWARRPFSGRTGRLQHAREVDVVHLRVVEALPRRRHAPLARDSSAADLGSLRATRTRWRPLRCRRIHCASPPRARSRATWSGYPILFTMACSFSRLLLGRRAHPLEIAISSRIASSICFVMCRVFCFTPG